MTLVLDASVTLAWAFEDEIDEVTDRLADEEALVPVVWSLEVGNGLLAAEWRRRITRAEVQRFVALLGALLIEVDEGSSDRALEARLDVARQYELSIYDAAYLELAMRRGVPLATNDERLRRAAEAAGVPSVS